MTWADVALVAVGSAALVLMVALTLRAPPPPRRTSRLPRGPVWESTTIYLVPGERAESDDLEETTDG